MRRTPPQGKIGLALAGGGPLGAMYELGALAALSDCLEGVDLNGLDIYVGVSAGGFIAAGLANGIPPRTMAHMFVDSDRAAEPFAPDLLLRPALREYVSRAVSLVPLLYGAVTDYLGAPWSKGFFASFLRLSRAIPTGIFNNTAIDAYLRRAFAAPGRSNDFRQLRRKLFLIATDLDSGQSVQFGAPGHDDVPISTAVQASAALPGLFPPVEIDGHHYVDGALKKTLHASVALRHGAKLVLAVNPLVPFDADLAAERGAPRRHKLVEGGLPVVLAQTFRAILHSRMEVGLSRVEREYRDADVVLFEPNRDDADMFFTNMFSYASRRRLSEHAYQKTRSELLRRKDELVPVLARHGIRLNFAALEDPHRGLLEAPPRKSAGGVGAVLGDLARILDDLDARLGRRRAA